MSNKIVVPRELLERLETWVHSDCSALEELRALLASPAVERQEPVAYADPKAFANFKAGLCTHEWMWSKPDAGLKPLYAEQPAPVAVVLPERKPIEDLIFNWTTEDVENTGWNACLDKVKELNP